MDGHHGKRSCVVSFQVVDIEFLFACENPILQARNKGIVIHLEHLLTVRRGISLLHLERSLIEADHRVAIHDQ